MARPKLRSPDQPLPLRWLLWFYETCASLQLAVVLIGALAVLLGWATFVESRFGTPAVHFGIYGTWWFAGLNVLLAWNVICAALIRFPWNRKHLGFLLTHAGIIILLLGCLLSQRGGIDAQLPIFEGSSNWRAFDDSQHLQLEILPKSDSRSDGTKPDTIDIPFAAGPFNWSDYADLPLFPWLLARRDRGLLYQENGIKLEVLDYYSDSRQISVPRVVLRVASNGGQTVSLDVQNMDNPHAPERRFGVGSREKSSDGTRIAFWMAGNRAETEAFRYSQPKGKLGPQGQLVLRKGDETFHLAVDAFQSKHRLPLGKTGLELELIQYSPQFLGVELRVHGKGKQPERMLLFADAPEFSQQAYAAGLFGSYWFDATGLKVADPPTPESRMAINAKKRRIDIILGSDGKLYYRAWQSPKLYSIDTLPADGTKVTAFKKSGKPMPIHVEDLIAADRPTKAVRPVPFKPKKSDAMKQRQALVRLTVDGNTEEFWLAGLPATPIDAPLQMDQRKVVSGNSRRVAISMPRDEIDVGFQVFLHKFDRRLDPGTSMASHYSSLVDFLDRHDENKRLQEDVLITLNAPVEFSSPAGGPSYRLFQESFRGPWRPGDPLFDKMVGGDSTRDRLFLSWLTVNYDPGRGLKYVGCLLIIAGIAVMFYMKTYLFGRRKPGPATS